MIRYPWSLRYLAAKKLGRHQLAESPMTAMTVLVPRIRRLSLISVIVVTLGFRAFRPGNRSGPHQDSTRKIPAGWAALLIGTVWGLGPSCRRLSNRARQLDSGRLECRTRFSFPSPVFQSDEFPHTVASGVDGRCRMLRRRHFFIRRTPFVLRFLPVHPR